MFVHWKHSVQHSHSFQENLDHWVRFSTPFLNIALGPREVPRGQERLSIPRKCFEYKKVLLLYHIVHSGQDG